MGDNFRSCQQIQNYSNLLCEETRHLYTPTDTLENIVWLTPISTAWPSEVLQHIDTTQKTALLRFRNVDAETGADDLSAAGVPFTFIPQLPIADITTETAWLYSAIAKYLVLDKYSVYDLIAEIPVEGNESRKAVNTVKTKPLLSCKDSFSIVGHTRKTIFLRLGTLLRQQQTCLCFSEQFLCSDGVLAFCLNLLSRCNKR